MNVPHSITFGQIQTSTSYPFNPPTIESNPFHIFGQSYDGKNTWKDWGLVPSSRPVFAVPSFKEKYIDLPGSSGKLDLSTSLTGYPTFDNREGSFEFYVMNKNDDPPGRQDAEWYKAYSDIMGFLHGQKMAAVLEDDPGHYYEGRFTVNEWNSKSPPRSTITIDYSVDPYKRSLTSSIDNDWLWSPFLFAPSPGDVIPSQVFANIEIENGVSDGSLKTKQWTKELFGDAPVCPLIIVQRHPDEVSTDGTVSVEFTVTNKALNMNEYKFSISENRAGTGSRDLNFVIYNWNNKTDKFTMQVKGTKFKKACVSILFYKGML